LFLFDQLFSLAKTGCPYGIFFLPVLNPDGILLSLSGLDSVKSERQKKRLFELNNKSTDFSLWKANSRGVDLNTNFDADWGKGAKNIFSPASENFVGTFPQSEKESAAIASFVLKTEFAAALSFHTKGEVIFYGQKTKQKKVIQDELHLAKFVSHKNHYDIVQSTHSAGGLSDFIGIKKHIPAITIELGNDLLSHPLTKKDLPEISAKNKGMIEGVCEYLNIF
ncbi:MAG: M14 family zinc carboxypeptidase, partial [Clostridia bacterium]